MRMTVNGAEHDLPGVAPWRSLLDTLRDELGLRGSKSACAQGECGSCTVLLDDVAVCSCLVPVAQAEGRRVVTVEGLDDDHLASALRERLCATGGVQCGFCTPGFVVAATALLRDRPQACPQQVREGLAGNLCRCTGYQKILQAVDAVRDEQFPDAQR